MAMAARTRANSAKVPNGRTPTVQAGPAERAVDLDAMHKALAGRPDAQAQLQRTTAARRTFGRSRGGLSITALRNRTVCSSTGRARAVMVRLPTTPLHNMLQPQAHSSMLDDRIGYS